MANLVSDVELVVELVRTSAKFDIHVQSQQRRDEAVQRQWVALKQIRHPRIPTPSAPVHTVWIVGITGQPRHENLDELCS